MTAIDRRDFIRRAGVTAAGLATMAGPMQAIFARSALAVGSTGVAPNNGGYGPLVPIPDKADGAVRLHLPRGFNYRSFAYTGTLTDDGVITPGRHDGMAAFQVRPGRYRLVRNHEINGPGTAFGDVSKAYDGMAKGGTTTLEVAPRAQHFSSWVSANGTQMNCAGGGTPWGSWVTAEETVNGPDVGPDFTGGDNTLLEEQHGYIFEVPASWGIGEYERAVPIRSAGRFAHEAVDLDRASGVLYETEDNFNFPSGFYRYIAPQHPMRVRALRDGGELQMLKVKGQDNAVLDKGQTPGVTYDVEWVTIDEPDTTFPAGTTNDQAINFVGDQGRAKGGAIFSRLEGIFADRGKIYLVSTQGGDTPPGETRPSGGYGEGFGQLWVYDTRAETLTLLFESPSRTVLELPDNMCISPQRSSLLCEDGPIENFLRGITPKGGIFDFALNAIPQREREEFAGSTFTPDGRVLFVNIQAESALTFAIWGPFAKGAL
ncbi:MAG: alkaline phosphatase PhoX [Actinomycetota bacterium]